MLIPTIVNVDPHRILVSLRQNLGTNIWGVSITSPLIHALFRWRAPGTYRRLAEAKEAQRADQVRRREEREKIRQQGDPEGSILGEPTESGLTSMKRKLDEARQGYESNHLTYYDLSPLS